MMMNDKEMAESKDDLIPLPVLLFNGTTTFWDYDVKSESSLHISKDLLDELDIETLDENPDVERIIRETHSEINEILTDASAEIIGLVEKKWGVIE